MHNICGEPHPMHLTVFRIPAEVFQTTARPRTSKANSVLEKCGVRGSGVQYRIDANAAQVNNVHGWLSSTVDEGTQLSDWFCKPLGAMDDRRNLVPKHTGPNVLLCSPLFIRLLRFAHERPPRLAVRDVVAKTEASYLQLIADVLVLKNRLEGILGADVFARIKGGDEVYIAVLAPGGYEYVVAMLAVLATGAAAVPITMALPPAEAVYYTHKSRAVAVLTASSAMESGRELENLTRRKASANNFRCIPITPSTFSPVPEPGDISICSDGYLDPNGPGIVIFTSGTTGPPKGAVMRRSFTHDDAFSVADHYRITRDDVLLHLLPVHHATGVGMMTFPFLISGACIEYRSGSFDPAWTWERWRKQGLTFFSGVPTIYMRMKRYYEQHLAGHPDAAEYIEGARRLRIAICGTSALPKPIADFWTDIFGKKIMLRFGGTEFGAVIRARLGDESVPDGSVGEVLPGVELKLSDGEEGEVLARSPWMFSKYLYDPETTKKAHDENGFYHTGDIARREGRYYWILGRASVDIIKSGGYKISALDIEREVLSLPYIQEVTVVGVEDEEFGQRVAAAVVPREGEKVTLEKLRQDLSGSLARYKMPTLLRLMDGELPKSATGKIVKKTLGPELFPQNFRAIKEVQVWDAASQDKAITRSRL